MQLTDDVCDFLTGGISIMLASRNPQFVPSLARAKGCSVISRNPARLRILVSQAQAGELIDDIRSSGMISATFSVPSTHKSLQLKGNDARIAAMRDEDRPTLDRYLDQFAADIGGLGFSDEFTRAFFASPGDEVAIEFTPGESFEQTPGPSAGTRLA